MRSNKNISEFFETPVEIKGKDGYYYVLRT